MPTNMERVKEFHTTFNHPCPLGKTIPKRALQKLRMRLIREEVKELSDAVKENDYVEIADALGDILYVTYGMALVYGIPIDKVFAEIHDSNMSKLGLDGKPIFREDGKILKGPNYRKPDIKKTLDEHFGTQD